MEVNMRETTLMGKSMDKELISGQMVQYIKENGKKIKSSDMKLLIDKALLIF